MLSASVVPSPDGRGRHEAQSGLHCVRTEPTGADPARFARSGGHGGRECSQIAPPLTKGRVGEGVRASARSARVSSEDESRSPPVVLKRAASRFGAE